MFLTVLVTLINKFVRGPLFGQSQFTSAASSRPHKMGATPSRDAQVAPPSASQSPAQRAEERQQQVEPFPFFTLSELSGLPPIRWLIEGIVELAALTIIFGPPGVGKSFVVLDWSLRVAYGLGVYGRPVSKELVVYIAAEGAAGLTRRIEAWRQANGKSDEGAAFIVLPHAINLLSSGGNLDLMRLRLTFDKIAQVMGCQPGLVVVDTVARSFGDGDENATRDMNAFVRGADSVREHTGAAVILVHHTGKDPNKGSRGSTALLGAVNAAVSVASAGAGGKIKVVMTKQKEAECLDPIAATLQTVTARDRNSGEPFESCVVVPNDEGADASDLHTVGNQAELTSNQRRAYQILREAPEGRLAKKEWRKLAEAEGMPRTTFQTILQRLTGLGLVRATGDGDEFEAALA